MGRPDGLPRDETIDFVLSCQHESGGFGAAPGHDAHLLYTVSAVQILATVDAFGELERRGKGGGKLGVGKCTSLQFRHTILARFVGGWLLMISARNRYCSPPEPRNRHLRRRRMGRGRHPLPLRIPECPLPPIPPTPRRCPQSR
jgi:hypothetical protein